MYENLAASSKVLSTLILTTTGHGYYDVLTM